MTVIRALALRHSSHNHKPTVPVNEPPNDHLPFKVATLDDLPVPEGDYFEDFKKQNRKYWRHFILGVSWLAFTTYFVSHVIYFVFWMYGTRVAFKGIQTSDLDISI